MELLYQAYQAYKFRMNNVEYKNKMEFKSYRNYNMNWVQPRPNINWDIKKMSRQFDYLKDRYIWKPINLKEIKSTGILTIINANHPKNISSINLNDKIKEQTINEPEDDSNQDELDFTLLGLLVVSAGIIGTIGWVGNRFRK